MFQAILYELTTTQLSQSALDMNTNASCWSNVLYLFIH